ncbi:MAG: hypothetical protein HXY22_04695 [Alphaproteobacteria bacterium]|nr:hypothetical protein [Alphaproteobacteria bacterium]
MTRVTNLMHQQVLLNAFLDTQSKYAKTEEQISTGKVGDQFKDMAPDTGVLMSAKRTQAQTIAYEDTAKSLSQQLSLQDLHLNAIADSTKQLRQTLTEAVANDAGITVMEQLEGVFTQAVAMLNSKVDGRYIYGGTRTDTAPVNVSTIDDLQAAASIASVFENNSTKASVKIDAGETIEYGFLASDIATDLFQSIKDIADYNDGPNGPFSTPLTDVQRQFLESEIGDVINAYEGINLQVAQNGLKQNSVDAALERHETAKSVLAEFISNIEDVDLAEAVTQLNSLEVASQASAQVLSDVNQLSLLNFLE